MKNPLVSVIIPTYNRDHTIAQTIDSVLQQTHQTTEVIVIDDGSTDTTQEVLRRYKGAIRNIRQNNSGQMVARNRGIQEARGEIITFLDSDDLWMPRCLEIHVRLLQRTSEEVPCSLVNGWLRFSDGRKMTSFQNSHLHCKLNEGLCFNMPDILSTRFVMFCQFVAIRREALDKAKAFDEDLKFMEDYALPLRLALLGPWAFSFEPLVVWQQGDPESISISQRALTQEAELRESLRIIRTRYLHMIEGKAQFTRSRRLQKAELRLDQLELRAIKLRSQGHTFASRLLAEAVRYRKGLFRRSPWFPHMEVAELGP